MNQTWTFLSQTLQPLARALQTFLCPAHCLHCKEPIHPPAYLLCPPCFELLEWIDPDCCCPICQAPSPLSVARRCSSCTNHPIYLHPHISLYRPQGPMRSLFHHLATGQPQLLVPLLAALIVIRLAQLAHPDPSALIPFVDKRTETFFYRDQLSFLLAHQLASLYHIPCLPLLQEVEEGAIRLTPASKLRLQATCLPSRPWLICAQLEDSLRLQTTLQQLNAPAFNLNPLSIAVLDIREQLDI